MFRFFVPLRLISLLVLTFLAAACSQPTATPTPEPATEVPPTTVPTPVPPTETLAPAPTATLEGYPFPYPVPTQIGAYPAPTENVPLPTPSDPVTSLAGLSVLTPANASQATLLAAIPTYQDARVVWVANGTQFAVFHPFSRGEIWLFSLTTGSLAPVILQGHSGPVTGAAFSPDGATLVSTGQDGYLRVWDTQTGTQSTLLELAPFFQNATFADGVEFSPDGNKLGLFVIPDSALYLFPYPLDGTQPVALAWTEHASPVVSVYPSPDWQTFAWVGRGTLVLMNADGTFRGEQRNHEDFITNVFFSPDSQRLFLQTSQFLNDAPAGVVIVYNVQSVQPVQTLIHPDSVVASALSPNAVSLAASSASQIILWDWPAGSEKWVHSDLPGAYSLAFSPDGSLLAGTFKLGMILVWDASTGQVVASYQPGGELAAVRFVVGGTALAATQYDGTMQVLGIVP